METNTQLQASDRGQVLKGLSADELRAVSGGLDSMALAQEAAAKLEDRGFIVKIVSGTTANGTTIAAAVPVGFKPLEVEGVTI